MAIIFRQTAENGFPIGKKYFNSNCNTLNNTCINIVENIDWVYNNFKNLESVFTVDIGEPDQQPILECLQNNYNEFPCGKFILGFMTVGSIHIFIGYKINNGDYCSFFFVFF